MRLRFPASLKLSIPLILLGFAASLSTVNLLYHVPRAERTAEEDSRKRLAQEMSRLQSTLEYLLLKGDQAAAQHEIAVLAHNHDYAVVALTDERHAIIAATRRAWLGRQIADMWPQFDRNQAAAAIRERRARVTVDPNDNALLGYAGILMGSEREELRPSRAGSLFVAYDLNRSKSEARTLVLRQSFYWAGWLTALALAMWLVFYFRSDEALKVSEASYRAIFDAAEDAIFVHDATTGAILDVNRKACATFGYTREELRQLDVGALGTGERPYTQQDAMELIRRAFAGEELAIEWHGKSKDGNLRWHEVFVKRVTIGGQDRILALARDITEKKRAGEELARQRESLYQREKLAAFGSLLAGVAQELNNPLSVVVARAVMLEEQGYPATRTAALKIRTAAERCARIVRTFLAMARQQQPERGPVAINDVVSAALDITGYTVRTSSIEVTLDLGTDIPPMLADADQLHQVLLNLIINAQQALQDHPAPRRIRLASRFDPATDVIRVTVADNGPGIPEHLRARVFDPYFTTKPIGTGLGVGLAVSLGIVEAHGGTLTADCPIEGGAVFTVALPVGTVGATGADPKLSGEASASERRVLIVDDEAEIREALAEILTGARHRVVTASSGREALERMAVEHYDVILTDIRMPDLDGRALYREIERRWPERVGRVVFVTGDTLASTLREFAAETGRPVIEKPFLPSDVRRVVAEMTVQRRA